MGFTFDFVDGADLYLPASNRIMKKVVAIRSGSGCFPIFHKVMWESCEGIYRIAIRSEYCVNRYPHNLIDGISTVIAQISHAQQGSPINVKIFIIKLFLNRNVGE